MIERIEDTLNGGYQGLHGEVVLEDIYRMKSLNFVPEKILDIGGNVGIYTNFVKELFPDCTVIYVEPDKENFAHATHFNTSEGVVMINKGIGEGRLHRHPGVPNGAHESYISEGLGFTKEYLDTLEATGAEGIMLDELINTYIKPGDKTVAKIDCEGAENLIFDHAPSMEALKQIDYIVLELHFCSVPNDLHLQKVMMEKTLSALIGLTETHICEFEHIYFYATKR